MNAINEGGIRTNCAEINKFWQKNSNPFSMANGFEINSTKSIRLKMQNNVYMDDWWPKNCCRIAFSSESLVPFALHLFVLCAVLCCFTYFLLDCHLFERHFQLFTQGLFRHFFCINIWYWLLPSHSTATHTVVVIIFIIADYTNIHSMNRVKLI